MYWLTEVFSKSYCFISLFTVGPSINPLDMIQDAILELSIGLGASTAEEGRKEIPEEEVD